MPIGRRWAASDHVLVDEAAERGARGVRLERPQIPVHVDVRQRAERPMTTAAQRRRVGDAVVAAQHQHPVVRHAKLGHELRELREIALEMLDRVARLRAMDRDAVELAARGELGEQSLRSGRRARPAGHVENRGVHRGQQQRDTGHEDPPRHGTKLARHRLAFRLQRPSGFNGSSRDHVPPMMAAVP
jgi:hypothetical protein